MKIRTYRSTTRRPKADLLVLPYCISKGKIRLAGTFPGFQGEKITSDFSSKVGETLILYPEGMSEARVLLLGLGEESSLTTEGVRRAYASCVQACRARKIRTINLLIPKAQGIAHNEIVRGCAEGIFLSNYVYEKNKSGRAKGSKAILIEAIALIGGGLHDTTLFQRARKLCDSVCLARNLINGNADEVTPQYLAEVARSLAKKHSNVHATIFNKRRIEKEKMGLLLAVNRGSVRDPSFIILKYRGDPKSKEHTVIVGKGVTFDSGGLNLKKTGSMEMMRCDMSGAAAVFSTIDALASLKVKVNVTAVCASTENCIDADSYKPGDVYTGYAGKTIEISNTDAEGRLILADAIAYSVKKLKPTRLIDIATLTGAVTTALGHSAAGLISNDDTLAQALQASGERTGERVWRLPLYEEFRKVLNSDIADMKNTGNGNAGASVAAAFLKEFVGDIPWAHLDIAGTAFLKESLYYNPKNGTGTGVRLLVDFFS